MRWLDRFSDWFSSARGFLWIFGACIAWLPFAFVGTDPHGFWFLFAATWFSAWTQPALAYGMGRIWLVIHELLLNQQAEMKVIVGLAQELKSGQEAEREQLEELQDDLDSLANPDP